MDREGFRQLLKSRMLSDQQIETALRLAERFEDYIAENGKPDAATTWEFSKILIHEGNNTHANYLAMARYGTFIHNNDIYIAVLELLDGAEAQPNLYHRLAERFGEALRDEVFAEVGIAPLGIPSTEKPVYMFPVLERLIDKVGQLETEKLLKVCLRDLPDDYYRYERSKLNRSNNIDDYIRKKHRAFVQQLRLTQRKGQLFFAQEVTDDVIAYVKNNPEIESGVREGNILYVTKIPYNTKQYLLETDPTIKRYYACHCPWAREAIRNGGVNLNPTFCNCSGGFSKKPWEVIFSQTLDVDMLESVIKGDLRCRFAIHLPENLEIA